MSVPGSSAQNAPALATTGPPSSAQLHGHPPCPKCGSEEVHEGTGFPDEKEWYICSVCETSFLVQEDGTVVAAG